MVATLEELMSDLESIGPTYVYVNDSAATRPQTYHHADCHHRQYDATKLEREHAAAYGLTPCSLCKSYFENAPTDV